MPWNVVKDERCPSETPWGVVKEGGELEGCHATEDEAKAQQAALYAAERSLEAPDSSAPRSALGDVRENLVRVLPAAVSLRADDTKGDGRLGTLVGRLANYGQWAEVDSAIEGHFMERIMPGAFAKTFAENRSRMRAIFDHGKHPQIGRLPLGPIDDIIDTERFVDYEVGLLDTSYNRDLAPGFRAGVYGNSFRFNVPRGKDQWDYRPRRSTHNPEGLPEHTVFEAKVAEFGPTPFPIYDGTSTGMRSMTDAYFASLIQPVTALAIDGAEDAPHSDDASRSEPIDQPHAAAPPDPPSGAILSQENDMSMTDAAENVQYVTRDEKAARVTELTRSVSALAVEYPGVMPDEAQARWDAENREIDTLSRDIEAWDARQARLRAFVDRTGPGGNVDEPTTYVPPKTNQITKVSDSDLYDIGTMRSSARSTEEYHQTLRDNAMRSVEQARFPHERADQDGARAWVAHLLDYRDSEDKELALRILATGSPQYRRDFNRYIRSGGSERGTALAVGVDATGGFAVPYAFDPSIIAIGAHTSVNPYRAAARTVTISGTDTWQALTATAVVAAYALEAAAATEQGPTFARPEYIAKRAHAFVTISYEMAQDRPDISSELSVLFQEAKDNLEEAQFTTGAGTTVFPQGMFLDGAFTAVETIGNNVVAVADIYALEAALPIKHRANAAWFLNRSVIHTIAGFETATGHLFNGANYQSVGPVQQNPGGNTGLRLLGYPVWEVPSASALITTSAAIVAVFCDPRNYVIVDRIGMSVKVIPDMLNGATPSFPTGEIGIYAFWRNTARVLNVDAGRQLKINAP